LVGEEKEIGIYGVKVGAPARARPRGIIVWCDPFGSCGGFQARNRRRDATAILLQAAARSTAFRQVHYSGHLGALPGLPQ
jgi:hypothetical protein